MYLISSLTIKTVLFLFVSLGLLFQTNYASAQLSQEGSFPQAIGAGGFGYSSPVFGNLDNDSDLEIVVGSFDGKVYAFNPDGSQVFTPYDTGTAIDATPTLADIDGDGRLEIIVTLGSSSNETTQRQRGGIIVLENDGSLKAKLDGAKAQNSLNGVPASPPLLIPEDILFEDGNADYVDGSVAVRDIDRDDRLDLVFGANDANIYALRNDLTLVDSGTDDDGDGKVNEDPGFERKHDETGKGGGGQDDDGDIGGPRCPGGASITPCLDEDPIDWPVDNQDTLSSTPALGDVDGDGDIEVVIGGGSSKAEASTCQEGGTVWVLHHTGNADKADPRFGKVNPVNEIVRLAPTGCTEAAIFSSPALVDIDNDDKLEIFVGASSDPRPGTNPNQVFGFRYNAEKNTLENLSGWPRPTGGFINSSPAIGDIDGDGQVEIVVASGAPDARIYAFNTDGTNVTGFPTAQVTPVGTSGSAALADVNGDGRADIVIGNAFDLFAFDGSGKLLTGFGGATAIIAGVPDELFNITLLTKTDGPINSTPAVGDIDNDGKVEIAWVSSDGKLYVIEAGKDTGVLPWPMFHRNAAHTGVFELNDQPRADVIQVATNQTSYGTGDTMTLFWSIDNSGSKGFKADVFLGAAFPDGSLLFFTSLDPAANLANFKILSQAQAGDSRNFKPAASSHNIAADSTMPQTAFFSFAPLPKGPGGSFIAFAALAKPGTVQAGTPQIIGISLANFTY